MVQTMKSDILDDKIFQALNMNDLSQAEKENFSKTFFAILNTRVNARLVEQMSPAQQEEYIRLIGEGDETKIEQFKVATFPDIRNIVDQETAKLEQDIMSGAEAITEEPEGVSQDDPFLTLSSAPPPSPPPGTNIN